MAQETNLLILDLDETLVRGTRDPLARPPEFRVGPFHIYERPFLSEFLGFCSERFVLSVWSSASDNYVQEIASRIFPSVDELVFVWGESRATLKYTLPDDFENYGAELGDYHFQKRLKKVARKFGWPLDQIVIVDDSPEKSAQNYGNVVHPEPFFGDPDDRELCLLASYLDGLSGRSDIRSIEKRNWRTGIRPQDW